MIRAFFKLKLRDRLILAGTVLLIVAGITAMVFNFLSGAFVDFSMFPRSVLMKKGDLQQYHYTTFSRLDKQIQFPGTDYGVSIGGEELYTTAEGTCFQYTQMIELVAALADTAPDTETFVKENFPVLLSGDENAYSRGFKVKEHDEGFLNTFATEYTAGILETNKGKFYLMAYTLNYDGHKFVMAASVKKTSYIKEAFWELDHMFYTFCKFDAGVSEESTGHITDSVSEDTVPYVAKAPTIELIGQERDYEDLGDVLENDARADYKLKYPDATEIKNYIQVDDSLAGGTAAFAFEYTYSAQSPSEAYLKSPSGQTYEPEYFNDELDGRLMFVVDKPESGTWEIVVSDDSELGEYSVHVMDYEDYMAVIGADYEATYETSEDEDFVSVSHTVDGAVVSVNEAMR